MGSCLSFVTDWTAMLRNGKVFIAGGYGGSGVLSSTELYDPIWGTSAFTSSLNTAHYLHRTTLLTANGKVLLEAGNGTSSGLASAELYER